jgi:transposase
MASFISCVVGVPGACCLMTFPHGRSFTTTFGSGAGTARGNTSMTCSVGMCGSPWAGNANPVRGVSIASPSRPPKKGVHGYDAHKHVNGRKRHIFVDTLGLLLAVVVTAANVQDRAGAESLLACLQHQFSRVRCIWADQAYTGDLVTWVWGLRPWRKVRLEIVKRPEGTHGFLLLPKRWVVERTFAWLGRYRRLAKDYEYLTQTSEAMIRVAMIRLMVHRLAHMTCF